jgi:ketosteroid isomerase-like protein
MVTITPHPDEIVTTYLTAFFGGDIATARGLVHEDFRFAAPLDSGGIEEFFAGAERKAALIRKLRIQRLWSDADEVATVYELDIETATGNASLPVFEWDRVRDGRVIATTMMFDTADRAIELMRDALTAAAS